MAYAAGPVISEYRLSLAKLQGDIAAVQRAFGAIAVPQITPTLSGGGGNAKALQSAVQLERANASIAAAVARTEAAQAKATATAATGYQRMVAAQNAAAVSSQRLAQAEQQTAQQIARTAKEAASAAAAQSRAEASSIRLAAAQQRQAAQQDRIASGSKTWAASIGDTAGRVDGLIGAVTGLGGAFAVVGAAQAGLDFARTGGQIAAARQSFDNLAASAGTSGAALLKSLQDVSAGTVANTNIIKSSNTALLLLGSDVASQLPQLLAVAKASATTLGTDVGQVFDSLVTGISRGSTELIDNAGITIKAGEAQAAYAAQIGKSVSALSASEKQQALLNGVLTAGQGIIAQTSGGGEAASASYQRFDASVANLTATLQTFAASGAAPAVNWLGQIAQAASDGITQLTTYGTKLDEVNGKLLVGTGSYAEYKAGVDQANQSIRDGYGVFGLFAQTIAPLSKQAYVFRDSLIATGVGAEQAKVQAQAYQDALNTVAETQNLASLTMGEISASYTQVAVAAQEAIAADAAVAAGVAQVVASFNERSISAAEAQAQIAALVVAEQEAAAAAAVGAGVQLDAAVAARDAAAAATEAAAASNADAFAKLEQAAAAEQASIQHDALDQAIRAAAAASGDAEAAAGRIAAQFGGVEAPQVLNLINLHRELAAARAGAANAAKVGAAVVDQRAGERTTGADATRAAFLERMASNRLKYEQEIARAEARRTKPSGGGGGSSGGGGAASREAKELQKLGEKKAELTSESQRKLEEAALDHAERLGEIAVQSQERQLEIIRQYGQKQLEAERSTRLSSLNSRADFYDTLTQASPEIGKQAADGLAAAYEQAFAQAQAYAQNGQAGLASSYLQLRQQQIQDELGYQQAVAQAKDSGDKAEVTRLQRIEAMRAAARAEELKQLLEGGDANVAAREKGLADETANTAKALSSEDARYAEAAGKIEGASATKAEKLARDEARVRGEVLLTNQALVEQARLQQATAGIPAAQGAGLPAAAAAAAAPVLPAALATTGVVAGGPLLIDYPALLGSVEALRADVARLDLRIGEVVFGVGATTEAARDTASAVRSQARGLR